MTEGVKFNADQLADYLAQYAGRGDTRLVIRVEDKSPDFEVWDMGFEDGSREEDPRTVTLWVRPAGDKT